MEKVILKCIVTSFFFNLSENDSSALKDKVTEEDGQYQVFRDFDFLNEIEEADVSFGHIFQLHKHHRQSWCLM